jgi:SAM-dependent methyltransferase
MAERDASARSGAGFEAAYHGTPPWEIGRPQAAFVDAADQVRGRVLDAGCGTGELALMAAAHGLDATGIDAASSAIRIARERCIERGLTAHFMVGDALRLAEFVSPPYDTVLDSGLLHVFDAADRHRYVAQLGNVMASGARYMALCFSEREPGVWGPHRLTRDDLRDAFAGGWVVESIEPSMFVLADLPNFGPTAEAWFLRAHRV